MAMAGLKKCWMRRCFESMFAFRHWCLKPQQEWNEEPEENKIGDIGL